MITTEVTDSIFKEAKEKVWTVTLFARFCFVGAALITVPLFLVLRKFLAPLIDAFLNGVAQGANLPPPMPEIAPLLTFFIALNVTIGLTEAKLIPFITDLTGERVFNIETVNDIAASEVPILDHVVKKATSGHYLVKLDINEQDTKQWRYRYSVVLKWLLLTVSSMLLMAVVALLLK